ncbi:MAG: hypothetical protein NC191_07530 [Muribaculaceae bacterium]|nr:hypothetical protein [Muribaculaceae bacterium]
MVTSATNLGVDSVTGKYHVLVKSDKLKGEHVIREFDDKYEARKFAYDVNHDRLNGQPRQDCFQFNKEQGFAPEQKPLPDYKPKTINLLPSWLKVGCDMPEDGGITGNMNKEKPKYPFVCY